MSEWTNEFTLTFLEAYQSEPVLWDPKHKFHKDRKKVNDAWIRLSVELDIAVAVMKKKKESLMATFRSHLRKKKASIQSATGFDEVYKPIWFAFGTMEAFLGPVYGCSPTIKTENFENECDDIDVEAQSPVDSYQNMTDETLNEGTNEKRRRASFFSVTSVTTRQPPRRTGQIPQDLQESGQQSTEPFSISSNVVNKKHIEEDECDLYGKILAKKLRKLPEQERLEFMYAIDGMYIQRYGLGGINNTLLSSDLSNTSQLSTRQRLPSSSESPA